MLSTDILARKDIYSRTRLLDPFLDRLLKEVSRIRDMPHGQEKAFHLYLTIKLRLLQDPDWKYAHPTYKQHFQINTLVDELLRSRFLKNQCTPFLNLAQSCRAVRDRMSKNECEIHLQIWITDAEESPNYSCIYNLFMPFLDILQCHAYFEVRSNVRLAVFRYLPTELIHLVFEYTMAAEEMPLDPRILVSAQNSHGKYPGKTPRKCRLPCVHEHTGWSDDINVDGRAGFDHLFVTGSDWVEVTPNFPHLTAESYQDIIEPFTVDEDLVKDLTFKYDHYKKEEIME